MCKDFIEIKDNKAINIEGIFKKGHYVICLECETIKEIALGKVIRSFCNCNDE